MEDPMPPSEADKSQALPGSSGHGDGPKENQNSKKTNIRKRTKTGCLTCRKRRIKCDEGRPTCNNCIKSKRHCEGYSQRVIFKDPLGAHPFSGPFASASYPHGANTMSQLASQQARASGRGVLPNIAPRPPLYDYLSPPLPGLHYAAPYHGEPGRPPPFEFARGVYPSGLYAQQPNPLNPNLTTTFGPFDQHHAPQPFSPGAQQYYPAGESAAAGSYANLDLPRGSSIAPVQPNNFSVVQSQPQLQTADYMIDEDASLGESDDEIENSRALMAATMNPTGIRERHTSLRTFDAFARSWAVADYMNFPHAPELRDSAQKQIFEHFIKVTGPSMSLYERHPFDPIELGITDPDSSRGSNIWSYTFPVISFQHPGLLHAILALASLQLAKLQGNAATAAMRHYHIAIRRIARNVRTPKRRTHPATLAATLLLGYFEVWNSEHTTWCNHLYGARTLIAEMPLRNMSRQCLAAKSLRDRKRIMERMGFDAIGHPLPQDPNALDINLLTTITGFSVTADDYGLREDQVLGSVHSNTTARDIDNYENLRDLFWWYCKMDVYQSVLGGTKLFMEYEQWTQCPPRAPCSKLEAIYGTYDHLILLLGRLANFASRDTPRKRKAHRAQGAPFAGGSPPQFTGMIPTEGNFRVPMGFNQPRQKSPQTDPADDIDPEVSLQAAIQEWENIRHAFDFFESQLGAEFRHLSPEYTDSRDYPFGPVLQYRTFSVAGIWMNFYMGLIHLYRSHPTMPPAAMQSVGISARKTAEYAIQIGRIAVGLSDDLRHVNEINTVTAAALIESAFCMFVAAVQYRDDEQRKWVVRRMYDITRLTGWQSARQIADGCESSWIKAAQLGKGPPYVRATDYNVAQPEFVWHTARRIDRRIQEVEYSGEERRIVLARSERTHYALGLLGVEDDMQVLELQDNAFGNGVPDS